MSWNDLPGHFNFEDVYDQAVRDAMNGDTLVEVGVLFGRSLAYLTRKVIESGKRLRVVGVDAFNHDAAWLGAFEALMRAYAPEERERIELVQSLSVPAADLFKDESLRFVFIDADHSHAGVHADINAWLPKVERGGVLAGHDYHPKDWPGCWQAVRERFGEIEPYGQAKYCWRVRVP